MNRFLNKIIFFLLLVQLFVPVYSEEKLRVSRFPMANLRFLCFFEWCGKIVENGV